MVQIETKKNMRSQKERELIKVQVFKENKRLEVDWSMSPIYFQVD